MGNSSDPAVDDSGGGRGGAAASAADWPHGAWTGATSDQATETTISASNVRTLHGEWERRRQPRGVRHHAGGRGRGLAQPDGRTTDVVSSVPSGESGRGAPRRQRPVDHGLGAVPTRSDCQSSRRVRRSGCGGVRCTTAPPTGSTPRAATGSSTRSTRRPARLSVGGRSGSSRTRRTSTSEPHPCSSAASCTSPSGTRAGPDRDASASSASTSRRTPRSPGTSTVAALPVRAAASGCRRAARPPTHRATCTWARARPISSMRRRRGPS